VQQPLAAGCGTAPKQEMDTHKQGAHKLCLAHVHKEVNHAIGVAPLIVVP